MSELEDFVKLNYTTPGYYVYCLKKEGEIVYVGSSVNVAARIAGHSDKDFDEVIYKELDVNSKEEMLAYEYKLINEIKPIYNKVYSHNSFGDSGTVTKTKHTKIYNLLRKLGYKVRMKKSGETTKDSLLKELISKWVSEEHLLIVNKTTDQIQKMIWEITPKRSYRDFQEDDLGEFRLCDLK